MKLHHTARTASRALGACVLALAVLASAPAHAETAPAATPMVGSPGLGTLSIYFSWSWWAQLMG